MIIKNLLRFLLYKYPNNKWNWSKISRNASLSISFIKKYFKYIYPYFNDLLKINTNIDIEFIETFEKYLKTKQNWYNLSLNPNITLEIVKHFPDKQWNYEKLLENINPITDDMLPFFEEKIKEKIIFYYSLFSFNYSNKISKKIPLNIFEKYMQEPSFQRRLHMLGKISFELLKKYPDYHWNWDSISEDPNFTMEMIEYFSDKPLNWTKISLYTDIPLDIIKKNLNKPWDLYALSGYKPLTLDFIENLHPNQNLRWERISEYSYITLEFFEKYYHLLNEYNGLDIDYLSQNINISLKVIEKYSHLMWDWYELSSNQAITLEFIENHLDFKWNWNEMTKNPNITFEFIEKHIEKDWSFKDISINPNITLEFIEKYIDRIDFDLLSGNEFIYHNKLVKKHARIQLFYYLKYKISNDVNRHIILNYVMFHNIKTI